MADDEDAIYIDVIPRVDDSAADSAVSRLKDKFKDVAKDVGPEFMDALGNSGALEQLGTKLGEALSGPLKDLSEGTGLDLKNPLEKMLKQDMGGALDDIATQLGTKLAKAVTDPLHNVAANIGVDLDDAVSKALNKDWGGLATSLGKGVGGKLGDALGLKDLFGPDGIDGALDRAHSTISAFKSGDYGGALRGVTGLVGAGDQATPLHDMLQPITDTTMDVHALASQLAGGQSPLPKGLDSIVSKVPLVGEVEQSVEQLLGQVNKTFPTTNIDPNKNPHGLWGTFFGAASNLMPWVHDKPAASSAPVHDTGTLGGAGYAPASMLPAMSGGGTTTANEVDVRSSVATVSAGSVTVGGSISLPGLSVGGGSAVSSSASSSAGSFTPHASGGGGGLSVSGGSSIGGSGSFKGFASGGVLPGDSPGHDNMIGVLPSGSAVGLEGGEGVLNPHAMSLPGVAALVSSLNTHYDEGTPSVGGDPNNTTLSTPPTTEQSHTGNAPITQQQLGTGQGAGISGGGLIGAAEQAGVMAAAIGGFGGGGIAAQMAVQETNLAAQKISQMTATLAAAPFEEFGLGGGMMGAPQVNPMGGWIGKVISGMVGQQSNIPNIAGSVQAPKQPGPKDPNEQQPQGETPSGPSGDKDDPMHVKVTNQQGPPQGSATSAMSTMPAMTMGVP